MAGSTAEAIEQIMAIDPVVTIDRIDESGTPWFDFELRTGGSVEYHSMTVIEDESWEHCV